MLLPIPTADEVILFQKLHAELDGTEPSEAAARAELTRLVQFWYLTGSNDAYRLPQLLEENRA